MELSWGLADEQEGRPKQGRNRATRFKGIAKFKKMNERKETTARWGTSLSAQAYRFAKVVLRAGDREQSLTSSFQGQRLGGGCCLPKNWKKVMAKSE